MTAPADPPGVAAPLLRRLVTETGDLPLSFELFPPRTEAARDTLFETVARLAPVAAGYSVTMGAGGATRAGTRETAVAVARRTGRPVTAHLTALGLSRAQALETADRLVADGIAAILALRGDPPRQGGAPAADSFAHAADLVAALRARHPGIGIAVAAYPEKHPEAPTAEADLRHLKEKLDAGADRAICQFVLDADAYGRFLEDCARIGIDKPVLPGVMPLENWGRLRDFAARTGASVPCWLDRLLAAGDETPEIAPYLAAAATVEQVRRLIAHGAPALHVYALNRWPLPLAIARLLGKGAAPASALAAGRTQRRAGA